MAEAAPVVLFDFDGTLVRGDCVARFLRQQLAASRWRRLGALPLLPLLGLFRWERLAVVPASAFSWLATVGRPDAELAAVEAEYIARLAREPARWLISEAVERLRAHRDAGERVLIVTGASQRMATALWSALAPDLADVPVLGSSLRRFAGGWIARRHNVGARKLRTLAEQGVSPPFAVAYSDSSADLAMLAAAQRVVLVAPRPAQQARITARLAVHEVLAPRAPH